MNKKALLVGLAISCIASSIFCAQSFAATRTVSKVFQCKDGKMTEISMDKYNQLKSSNKYGEMEKSKDGFKQKGHTVKQKSFKADPPKYKNFSSLFEDKTFASLDFNVAVVTLPIATYTYRYEESGVYSEHYKWSDTRRITSPVKNSTTHLADITYTCSTTQALKANISLDSGKKDAIGGNYESSVTTNTQMKMQVSPLKYGWIEFTPETYNSWGYMDKYKYNIYTGYYEYYDYNFADLYVPKKIVDENSSWYTRYKIAGLYELVESDSMP